MRNKFTFKKGFTIMEILIVIALIAIFLGLTVPFGMDFYRQQVLEEVAAEISNTLKTAQSYAQTGRGSSSWGVRFFEEEFVLFMGNNFSERDETRDRVFDFPSGINVPGEIEEVVFEIGTGYPRITKVNE